MVCFVGLENDFPFVGAAVAAAFVGCHIDLKFKLFADASLLDTSLERHLKSLFDQIRKRNQVRIGN